jgi:hypothetical protein
MRPSRIAKRLSLVLIPALLAATFLLAAATPALAAAPQQSITFTGEETFSMEASGGEGEWNANETWNYGFAQSASGNLIEGPLVPWSIQSFDGQFSDQGTDYRKTEYPQNFDCDERISIDPGEPAEPGEPTASNPPALIFEEGGGWSVIVQAPAGIAGEQCGPSATSGNFNTLQRWLKGEFKLHFPKEGSYTMPVEETLDCAIGSSPNCVANTAEEGTLVTTIKGSVTFSSGGTAPPSQVGPTTPQPPPAKAKPKNSDPRKTAAAKDLEKAFKDAIAPCGVVAYGTLAAATKGGMLTGSLGGKDAADALADKGQEAADAWKDQCDAAINRIKSDYKTAEDPPLPSWDVLARPHGKKAKKGPSCKGLHGAKAKLCALGASQEALVAAAKASASLAGQIETTIDRETGALEGGDQKAAGAQGSQAATLGKAFDAATKAQAAAEGAFTAALGKAGFKLDPTKAARAKAAKLIEGRLAGVGISDSDLGRYVKSLPS